MLLIGVLVVLIAMSAYFSATETAFTSFNCIRLKNMAQAGSKKAQLALNLSENYDKLLSTILIGNNIVNISSASLATVIFTKYFGNAGVTLSTVVMTVLVLIFGEISPKSLAKESPERFAMFSAPITRLFLWVLAPVNWLFMQWKKLLSMVFKAQEDKGITEEELLTIVDEAQNDGGIGEQEGELLRSAIEFHDLDVSDILTPRVDVVAVSDKDTPEEVAELFRSTGFSRLPYYEDTIDNIKGVINQKDFYGRKDWKAPVKEVVSPVLFITDSMKISRLLHLLQQNKAHMAVVTDEYGGTAGIVTLEDVIEELVGDIWDEHDAVEEEDFEKIAERRYRVEGSADLEEMLELFGMEEDPELDVSTVNGWVLGVLGRIPKEGEVFQYDKLTAKVTKADERRVIEVEVNAD